MNEPPVEQLDFLWTFLCHCVILVPFGDCSSNVQMGALQVLCTWILSVGVCCSLQARILYC